ncbi:MAG: hypothetical protein LUQ38_10445 [Methanotrichaceae archaeon]|nr:hypothetical protein [Methanotrichaceae archaeon]
MPKEKRSKFAEEIPPRMSRTRKEIEALLLQNGMIMERRISVLNLDNGEIRCFDSYPEAVEFLKGRKGRWYITTPGIRSLKCAQKK